MLHSVIETPAYGYAQNRNTPELLIEAHSALVRRTAWHVHSRMSSAIEVEDLMQIGMIALIEAARTFEDRGIAFAPYASTRVRGAMIDELRRDARMSRSGMANRRLLASTRSKLENELGRAVSDGEMARALEMDAVTYHATVASSHALRQDSIDETYSDHDMFFADLAEGADTQLEQAQLRVVLANNIALLAEREALVLHLYFVEELNLDEIGETLGVGAARVCQIKKKALDKLREQMEEQKSGASGKIS
jgi:RNA polymerase sigma factor FliA